MARQLRHAPGGLAYHVMNRTSGQIDLFQDSGDYEAFERVLYEALEREKTMRLCAYCLMPNHFHLVLWPTAAGQLSRFMQWMTMTHTQRWHAHRHSIGGGHLYQGRFKSFAIEQDGHFLGVCRYVERNPLRANLVNSAEQWRWSSLWTRGNRDGILKASLSEWPVAMPRGWPKRVNEPQDEQELAALRNARQRGCPYGTGPWVARTARRLGLESTLRKRGRPKKPGNEGKDL